MCVGLTTTVMLAKSIRTPSVAVAFAFALTLSLPLAADPVPTIPRIGVLVSSASTTPLEQGLRAGLRELGYREGENILIAWMRFAGRDDEIRALARELVRANVDLIVTVGSPATRAVLDTTAVPVVFASGDPVAAGFATSLARPGGNATGVSVLSSELYPKRLDLLHQLAPAAKRIAVLRNPENPLKAHGAERLNTAARVLGVRLENFGARDAGELRHILRSLQRTPPEALLVSADTLFLAHKREIAEVVRKAKIPAIFPWTEYHEDGVLMTYGLSAEQMVRSTAPYVDKILRGSRPADLPIEQYSTYELVLNLRVAREMGIDTPQTLLLRANEVLK
jgi:putative ABC transport system substrate-binding protein